MHEDCGRGFLCPLDLFCLFLYPGFCGVFSFLTSFQHSAGRRHSLCRMLLYKLKNKEVKNGKTGHGDFVWESCYTEVLMSWT